MSATEIAAKNAVRDLIRCKIVPCDIANAWLDNSSFSPLILAIKTRYNFQLKIVQRLKH